MACWRHGGYSHVSGLLTVLMIAGPDEVCGPDPNQIIALEAREPLGFFRSPARPFYHLVIFPLARS
jgi:hypothetical protein